MPQPSASRRDFTIALAGTRFREVRWFAALDSTNRYLADEAIAGASPGLVAVADEQSAGRGRLGRTWIAPAGASLLVSVLLDGAAPPEERHLVVVAAALAGIDAVDACCGFRPRLKWPNDLVVGDRKLAGLLAEAAVGPGAGRRRGDAEDRSRMDVGGVVVGMGLNVDWGEFPADLEATATACNREGHTAPRADLLVTWLRALDRRLQALANDGPSSLRADNIAASATLGRRVRVERARDTIEGEANALTDLGHLVVRTGDGLEHTISAGDVIHLRPTA
jgi:BirA family transcriptional regulator, biotin operon repressor / biotin---[acetyl-CoA-carboxylase] ligase